MKTEKYCLVLAVVIGILCVPALGEVELPLPDNKPVLLGTPNPALAGIEKLNVDIVPPDSEPNKDGLVWRELEAKVINKLNEAGIKIMPGIAGNILNIDELRVYIDMLKFADSQQYVFRVQASVSREVRLARTSNFSLRADVWKTEPAMQAALVQNMPDIVTDVVLEQVEAFICAYVVANPPDKQSSDGKTTDTVSQTAKRQQVKPAAKPAVAEYKYGASENSKVFHRPDCHWVKQIKPENLVGYNSRDEALKAGRRPCKQCKP